MENNSKSTVSEVIDHLIEKFNTQVRVKNGKEVIGSTNAKDYKMLKNSLEKFVSENYKKPLAGFTFRQIDSDFLSGYIEYLERRAANMGTKGALPNRLKKLQAVFNHARDMGIKGTDSTVFSHITEQMKISGATPLILSADIMSKIENIDRSFFSRTELFHIDLFLFSYYSGGMSCSDMAYLTYGQIKKGIITYEKMRTRKTIVVPLITKSQDIINRYRDKCYSNYVLPIFSAKHLTEKQQREKIDRLAFNINQTLIKVRKHIKFQKKITLSSTQAAFIARLKSADAGIYHIIQNTGCTMEYICKHFL
ncbi:phage integrase SAM-like domain-containing protein [Prevotella sp. 10(H)]|uniref:phage integrase SAM-like domain-containing protein n=1 Tax=Prevotella sp. 10(H) TaxID=1158294 RepID=UPI0004A779BC|nr:phage integrase SAM-like domain-containing protein [Prevotella sp. 10(H)]